MAISDRSRRPPSAQVERPRDRRGRERQHVDLGAKLLEPLLVTHAEAVLLVDDQEPQILEAHAWLQELVRADHDVDLARREAVERRLGLRTGSEARQELDADRPVGEAIRERLVVLLREQGGRARAPRPGGRPARRRMRLAAPPRSCQSPRRRRPRDPSAAGGCRSAMTWRIAASLIGRLLEREARPRMPAAAARRPRRRNPGGPRAASTDRAVQRRRRGSRRRALARLLPLIAAEPVQRRGLGGSTGITTDSLERLHRHVQLVVAGVLEQQELGRHAADVHRHEAAVAADAIVLVHHGAPGRRSASCWMIRAGSRSRGAGAAPARPLAEELLLGE